MADPRYLPAVLSDTRKWVLIPTSWSGRYSGPREWADAEAARRWDAWSQHSGGEPPGPNAVERTALELKTYADKYGGGGARRPGEDLTYLYLPDPAGNAFPMHVGVDDRPGLTVETAMAEPEAAQASAVEEFTTDALGVGRKIKLRGALDKRPDDPPGPPGEFVTVAYIFGVPGHHGVVLVRATDNGPEQIGAADGDLDEFVRSITVSPAESAESSSEDQTVERQYHPTVHCDTRKWVAIPATGGGPPGEDLAYRYLPDHAEPALVMHVGMDQRRGLTAEKAIAELQTEGTATAEDFATALGSARKVQVRGAEPASVCYLFDWPDQGVIVARLTDNDPQRIDAASPDLDEFVRCMYVSSADPSDESHPTAPHSRDLDRMGHLGKTAGEDGHSFSGTPLTRILHADVRRNPDKWLQVPLEWDDHYPSPPQWADAMAKQRWDGWAAAHPGTAHPASDAVARTATELQKVAEYYGGFDELRLNECLTYVYLPDPHQHGFMVHVEVSDSEDQTVEKYLADIDPTDSVKAGNDYLQPGEKPFRSQLDPGLTPTSEAFTTDALGEGRKITAHGTADPRPSDPPGPPGVWAETRYAFAVPGRHDLVQVQARSSDPASLAAAAPDLDEFVRGITTKSAELTGIPAGPYDMDALALLRAVHDRRKLQTILRECVGLFCLWIGVAIAVHVWVPGRYNLHHRMDHDAVAGMFLLGAIAAVPAVRLFIDKTRDPVGEAAAALVSGVEPEVVQEEEFDLYGPEVARGLVPLLRQKPLLNLSALGFGVGALPMIVIGAVGIRDAPAVGIVFLAIGALSIYNTIGLARYFANSERYIQSTTADASLADSVAALASGRRIVINLDPGPGRITLGLPLDAKVPGANAPTSHAKLVGAAALSVVVLLGLGVRYSGHHHPGATEAVRRTVTLGYLTAATSRPNVTIRTGPDVHADVQALMSTAGIPTGQFGAGWQVVITQFFRTPNPDLDVADLVAELTIVDIKRTPCAVAVKAAISPPGRGKPTPTTLSGLPTGWLAVQRPGPDNQTRGVTFAGCQAGTLVAATVYSPYPSMPDKTIATSASRLVSAIAQRGLAQFRADTAP